MDTEHDVDEHDNTRRRFGCGESTIGSDECSGCGTSSNESVLDTASLVQSGWLHWLVYTNALFVLVLVEILAASSTSHSDSQPIVRKSSLVVVVNGSRSEHDCLVRRARLFGLLA